MRPLDGITVVTLEHAIAAPYCTRQLADLGARVIKIERPGSGDFARGYDERVRGQSSHFVWTNRSKESLTLDVKHPEARPILDALIARADVLVQNLAPGAAARLGLSYDALAGAHPRLIVCDISGYGDFGPYRDKKAYDILVQAESGVMSVTGTPETPCRAGIPVADISAGMYGYAGILAALIERGKTGRGRRIEISMLESVTEWLGFPMYYAFEGQPPPVRSGASHPAVYPYGAFPAGDGKVVMLGVQNEREWRVFCEQVLERPELASDPRYATNTRRVAAQRELDEIIIGAFARYGVEEVVARLDAAKIANARMNDARDIWTHPQLAARGRWTRVATPAGEIPALRPPGSAADDEARMDPVPALGEHTDAILRELGYDDAGIARLRRAGAV
jgi:crotonobetainyl-CoA:carnitine CoA-transferase CaiB-like acyl-CoA transferase